jgi:hypothetical protein
LIARSIGARATLAKSETGEKNAMTVTNKEPYQQAYYPPKPTWATIFLRKFLPWQIVRFFVINMKMIRLMRNSHH